MVEKKSSQNGFSEKRSAALIEEISAADRNEVAVLINACRGYVNSVKQRSVAGDTPDSTLIRRQIVTGDLAMSDEGVEIVSDISHYDLQRQNYSAKELESLLVRINGFYDRSVCASANRVTIHIPEEFEIVSRDFASSVSGRIATLLETEKSVNLKTWAGVQAAIVELSKKDPGLQGAVLERLAKNRALFPQTEIFWHIDRKSDDYSRRFGLDVKEFLRQFSAGDGKQVLLEMGQGSGMFREETDQIEGYAGFSVSDRLYYPLGSYIARSIQAEEELSEHEKDAVSDFLYKILVIRPGQTHLDQFEYDTGVINDIRANTAAIRTNLIRKLPTLKEVLMVPRSQGGMNHKGDIVYPAKVRKHDSRALLHFSELLCTDPERYLTDNKYSAKNVKAYPFGLILSDFSEICRLEDDQIDMAFGVRSTVYLEGNAYVNFMTHMTRKLSPQGCYIDDSVRENFGWRYRLSELKEVQNRTVFPLGIVTGPGIPEEDSNKGSVPLAIVMTKSEKKLAYIRKNLFEDYQICDLDELTGKDS